ncbi:MAG: LacI family transcriptional regulator [Planctomycetota bacterium]|jgi:DNA-binding LacI/PurR family transcriptional regulator|nr:LacI family transcriptional regulator [Planctomycetota bacterium]
METKKDQQFTIRDVAKLAGVSTATVSRALNGREDVNARTRQKILKIAKDYNFRPNAAGRGLSMRKTFTIGVAIPDLRSSYFAEVILGVDEVAGERGYSTVIYNTGYIEDREREALRMVRDRRMDGMIMLLSNRLTDECRALVDMGYNVVLLGNALENVDCPSVACNNFASAYVIVEYLIKNGHTRIAHIGGNRDTNTGMLRMQGFMKAMENYGIPVNPAWNLPTRYFKDEAYSMMKRIIASGDLPTAVYAAADTMAIGCYKAIYEAGLRIPDDFSIVGHDDIDIASLVYPPLTTMRQQTREMGKTAARKLLDGFSTRPRKDITILPTSLVARQSVKDLSRGAKG